MILWGKKKETLLALARGAEKVKKGQGCFLGPLKGEGPVIYHWIPGDWCSLTWGPIFPNDIREEPSRMKKCYTSLRSSQDCWNQCFNNSLAVSGGGSFSFWLLSPAGYPGSTGVSSGPQFSHGCADTRSLPKPMSIESVMPSNHLILCYPLLLLPSIFPSIRVFSNESALHIRWPKYWSFSFSISPSNEHHYSSS